MPAPARSVAESSATVSAAVDVTTPGVPSLSMISTTKVLSRVAGLPSSDAATPPWLFRSVFAVRSPSATVSVSLSDSSMLSSTSLMLMSTWGLLPTAGMTTVGVRVSALRSWPLPELVARVKSSAVMPVPDSTSGTAMRSPVASGRFKVT